MFCCIFTIILTTTEADPCRNCISKGHIYVKVNKGLICQDPTTKAQERILLKMSKLSECKTFGTQIS
jgi:hypothetical protein